MNIVQEKVNELNAVITIHLDPTDYSKQANKALKEQSNKARIPGFRPGTPATTAHVKRLYGKSILVDALNTLVSDALHQYIADQALNILGQPLPKTADQPEYNWDFTEAFTFKYEIGLAPDFEPQFSKPFTIYQIQADQQLVSERISQLQRSYGAMHNPEQSEAGDILYGTLAELDEAGEVLPEGIVHTTSVRLDLIQDASIKQTLIGLQKGDVLTIDLRKAFDSDAHRLHHLLNISEEKASELQSLFRFSVQNVNRLTPAALTTDFFDKIFPGAALQTAAEFTERIARELKADLQTDADKKLRQDVLSYAHNEFKFELPEDFLKRWLMAINKDVSPQALEKEFDPFIKNLKWRLVENKIAKQNNIQITEDQVLAAAKEHIAKMAAMYNPTLLSQDQLLQYAQQFLQDPDKSNQLKEEILSKQVFDCLKNSLSLVEKPINYENFKTLEAVA